LEHARRDFSPKTVRETHGFIERTIKPSSGTSAWRDFAPSLSTASTPSCSRSAAVTRVPRWRWALVRRVHGIIRRALAQGVRWGWLGSNPAASASPPRVPAATIQPPTPAELERLLAAAEQRDPALATFPMLSAATGARRSELVALRWADVNLDRSVVTIARRVVLGLKGLVEKDTKTHQARRITVDRTTIEALSVHLHTAQERASICDLRFDEDGYVFTSDLGRTPWFPDSVSRRVRKLASDTGLPGRSAVEHRVSHHHTSDR
jgi:integrase